MAFNDNNPTDDWDNFGASQDAPNVDQGDDWDNWEDIEIDEYTLF